jgi:hypothetical protein
MTLRHTPSAVLKTQKRAPSVSAIFYCSSGKQPTLLQKLAAIHADTQFGHAIEYAAQLSFPALI